VFGFYRTVLAIMVVALHVGGIPVIGGYAVFGFYILSGYLMTFILHESYGYQFSGLIKYATNRFLRIYPMYWVSILLSCILIYVVGEPFAQNVEKGLQYPPSIVDIIKNIFILFPTLETARLTPPAWALTIELFFYTLIGLGLSRTKRIVSIWLLLSILYHIIAYSYHFDRYFTVFAASLPFATGAFIYHFKDEMFLLFSSLNTSIKRYLPIITLLFIPLNCYIGVMMDAPYSLFFYINYLLCSLMVLFLIKINISSFISKETDQWLGEFSYPIYLIHYQVMLLILFILQALGVQGEAPNMILFLISLPFIFALSWFMIIKLERPIEYLRAKIKQSRPRKS